MGGAQTTSTEALPFDVIDLTPTTVVGYRQPPSPDRPSATSSVSPAVRLTAAPGDSVKVRIFERYGGNIFPTIQGQSADLGIQRVAEDGTIKVPVVGVVQVAGLDLNQIERRIVEQLGNKVQEPEVIVEFDSPRTYSVMVSGDVKNPGRVSMLEDVRTVVDAINKAGGTVGVQNAGVAGATGSGANQQQIVVRRQGQVILTAQFSDLLAGADIPVQKAMRSWFAPIPGSSRCWARSRGQATSRCPSTISASWRPWGMSAGCRTCAPTKPAFMCSEWAIWRIIRQPGRASSGWTCFLPVSIFVAQQFGLQARDVIYVTNAPLYEYDKVLTSIYRTFSVVGVARGNLPITASF